MVKTMNPVRLFKAVWDLIALRKRISEQAFGTVCKFGGGNRTNMARDLLGKISEGLEFSSSPLEFIRVVKLDAFLSSPSDSLVRRRRRTLRSCEVQIARKSE